MKYSCVIKGGIVYDGSGKLPFTASLGIEDGKIAAISRGDAPLSGVIEIDAAGKAVAPGFIDFHSHSEWILPVANHRDILRPLLLQGVTTIVGGNCGFSPFPVTEESKIPVLENSRFLTTENFAYGWEGAAGFFDYLEKKGICMNAASLAGHGTLRAYIVGNEPRLLTKGEREAMYALVRRVMSEGAAGVSLGLAYVPGIFADEEELEGLFRTVAEESGMITVHGHTYSWTSPFFPQRDEEEAHNIRDIRFFLKLARKTGVRINLSHVLLKGRRTWPQWPRVLEVIEEAREAGVDVSFGVIPYHWGNTLINTLLPKWFLEDFAGNLRDPRKVEKLKQEVFETERIIGRDFSDIFLLWGANPDLKMYEGKSIDSIAEETGVDAIDAYLMLMKGSGGKAKILTASYSGKEGEVDEPLQKLIAHPLALSEIDTIITSDKGPHNPASFGAFPKLIGRIARDGGLMKIEEAIRKVTGMAADRARLGKVGYVKEGYFADITIFDPEVISDTNTIAEPDLPPDGIEKVLISGSIVVDKNRLLDHRLYGRVLRPEK